MQSRIARLVPGVTRLSSSNARTSQRTSHRIGLRPGVLSAISSGSSVKYYSDNAKEGSNKTESKTNEKQVSTNKQDAGSDVAVSESSRRQPSLSSYDYFDSFFPREFTNLRRQMDRMMRSMDTFSAFPRGMFEPLTSTGFELSGEFVPKMDVSETDKAVFVHAELPGMTKENVNISLQDGVLEISGNKNFEKRTEDKDRKYSRVERSYGSFVRRIGVPKGTKASDVKAKFQNGVLELEVPKVQQSKEQFEVKID